MNVQPDLNYSFCRKNRVLRQLRASGEILWFTEKTDIQILGEIQRFYQKCFMVECLDENAFEAELNRHFKQKQQVAGDSAHKIEQRDIEVLADVLAERADLLEDSETSPVVNFINVVLSDAIQRGASDIHIENYEDSLVIRYRIDGALIKIAEPPVSIAPVLISRVKIMAKLDIAEKRVPQDGRISLKLAGQEIDLRVSTLPSVKFERVVLRILDKERGLLSLSELGLDPQNHALLTGLLASPHGIVLVTGPTGSGKTTTLYAGLAHIDKTQKNILTIEDPIEYQIPGISQTQVNTRAGLHFATGLRAILRQDPDIILVGEIRDNETLNIALQASLTGHLVLSTLHTNSAVGAITRLVDMGADPYLISSSVLAVVSQRLVRRICNSCKTQVDPVVMQDCAKRYQYPFRALYTSAGCEQCNDLGYKGRLAIYEIFPLDSAARKAVNKGEDELTLQLLHRQKNKTIQVCGFERAEQGLTTLEEVLRVTMHVSAIED
jgi:general secretion pathway protein E